MIEYSLILNFLDVQLHKLQISFHLVFVRVLCFGRAKTVSPEHSNTLKKWPPSLKPNRQYEALRYSPINLSGNR